MKPSDNVTVRAEDGPAGALKYKVYEDGEPNCQQLPDRDEQGRKFSRLEANDVIMVLVSNVNTIGKIRRSPIRCW